MNKRNKMNEMNKNGPFYRVNKILGRALFNEDITYIKMDGRLYIKH